MGTSEGRAIGIDAASRNNKSRVQWQRNNNHTLPFPNQACPASMSMEFFYRVV